jgi:Bacterial extracellular solute-binding protein
MLSLAVRTTAQSGPAAVPGPSSAAGSAQALYQNAQAERRERHVTLDVGQASETNVTEAIANRVFVTADWVSLGVPPERVFQEGRLKVGSAPLAWVHNTEQVTAADAPKTWDDVLDPRWARKMDLDGRGGFMSTFLASPQLGGAAKGLEFARKLAAQKPLYEASSPPIEAKVISGEVALAVEVFSFVLNAASHPGAGQLLAAWLASPDGQAARVSAPEALGGRDTEERTYA